MKASDRDRTVLYILQYLNENSFAESGVTAASILAYLAEKGIETDRRTIYNEIKVLKDAGYPVHLVHKSHSYTYHIDHPFSLSDTFILMDAVQHNSILSDDAKDELTVKLSRFLPALQRRNLPEPVKSPLLSSNENVPASLELLLKAILSQRMVSFLYFDFTPSHTKAYRREGKPYVLQPVSLVSDRGRYYCIFWSQKHQNFANYRIDKMDRIRLGDVCETVPFFDGEHYMRTNFNMYRGEARSITLKIDNRLASEVFDTFGDDILITSVSRSTFTAIIHRPIVPTLTAWLFQFCDKVTVIEPADLKEEMRSKAKILLENLQNPKE